MQLDKDAAIPMRDGAVPRADVFRPGEHDDRMDRPPQIFGGTHSVHVGCDTPSSLLPMLS